METIRYKGFAILPQPYQLHGTKRWTVDLEIWRGGRMQHFSLHENYPSEQEAGARCSGVGRRIIDGHVPGCTVRHLPGRSRRAMRVVLMMSLIVLGLAACAGVYQWSETWDMAGWRESFRDGTAD
jgi:hypothetical protein